MTTDPVNLARECLLAMLADASRFEEDVDGEYTPLGPHCTVTYHLTVGNSQLGELCEALGIRVRFNETAKDAIDRTLAQPMPKKEDL